MVFLADDLGDIHHHVEGALGHLRAEPVNFVDEAVHQAAAHVVFRDHGADILIAAGEGRGGGILGDGIGVAGSVALEGALKILETAKHFLAIGYEAEDGLHGPCLGFTEGDIVIALNDGVNDEWISHGIVNFGKNELGQAYIFGADPIDENDLRFDVTGDDFRALEFAPAVETLAYLLAKAIGAPVLPAGEGVEHPSGRYFETHRG